MFFPKYLLFASLIEENPNKKILCVKGNKYETFISNISNLV